MKSTSILLAVIAAIALALAGLFLYEPTGTDAVDVSNGASVEQDAEALKVRQDSMAGSLTPEAEEVQREEVIEAKVAAKQSKAETIAELQANGPFLSGKVVNELGFPIAGADVRVTGDSQAANLFALGAPTLVAQDTTDAGGAFRASRFGLRGEEVQVKIKARGFIPYRSSHRADRPSGDASLGVMELERGVILSGVVRDANGRPVEGAKVRRSFLGEEGMSGGMMGMVGAFSGNGNLSDITDAEGRFELGNEPIGEYVVTAEHDAFEKARFEGNAPFEGYEKLDLVLDFPPSLSVAGVIQGFPTGKRYVRVRAIPIEDATSDDKTGMEILLQDFTGSGYDTEVAGDGSFLLQGLPADKTFELQASIKEGFMQNLWCSNSVRAKAGEQDVKLDYDSGAMVTFRIVDQESGEKIKGCVIRHRWTTEAARGFQIGAKKREFGTSLVELDELRPGEEQNILAFTISTPGYMDHTEAEVPVSEGERVDLGTIKLGKAPILRVRVLEAGSGKPLRRARVGLVDTLNEEEAKRTMRGQGLEALAVAGDTERTNKDGWVELPVCNTPTGTLTIRRSGYAIHVVKDVIMPVSGWREEIVNLSEGGEIEVLVLDTLGNPVNQAEVRYKSEFGSDGSGTTSKKGKIKFRDLPEGTYQLLAARPGNTGGFRRQQDSTKAQSDWVAAKVVSGVGQDLTLRVPQDTVLHGVVMADGLPLGGATVGFVSGPLEGAGTPEAMMTGQARRFRGGNSTVTDSNGAFELERLQPGNHRLNIQAGDAVPGQFVGVELREGENRDSFEIEIGTIEGVVLDASGNPAGGARVTVRHQSGSNQGNRRFMRSVFGGTSGQKAAEDGTFTIRGVPVDAPLILDASLKGHVDGQSEPVTVAKGDTVRNIKIALGLGASIRVTLTGEPAPFQMIRAKLLEAEEGEETQDASKFVQGSEALLKDLVPGRWEVWIANRGGDTERVEITVRAGEEGQVTLTRGT